jgi:spermidine/putrescine-binding protein
VSGLREISAQIVNEKHYATPNEAAIPFVEAELRENPIIFPPNERVRNGHLMLALSPQGEKLYESIWQRFTAAGQ